MKKTVTRNYIYNLLYHVFAMLTPLITTPYIARTLKAEAIGIFSYITAITGYCILLCSLGITLYGEREIAYTSDNKYNRTKVLKEILFLRFITMIISLIIYYFLFIRHGEYQLYFKIFSIEIIGNIFDISFFYQGMEEIKKIVKRNFIIKILSIIGIFIFIKSPNDLYKYILIYCLTTLFGNILLWIPLKKYICKVSYKDLNIIRNLKASLKFFIPQIAVETYFLLDKTMLGIILHDMTEVGYYDLSQKLVRIFLVVITALNGVISPRIARLYSNNDNIKIKEYIYKCFNFIFMYSFPIILGLIAVSNKFVPLFFGDGYLKVSNLVYISTFLIVLIGIANILGTDYLLPTKKEMKFTISILCGMFSNLLLNFILINKYKAGGASFATLMSKVVIISVQLYFLRKELNILKILKSSKNYLISSIIMFFVCIIIDNFISNNLICVIIQVLIGIVVYFSILFILKDKFIYEMKRRIIYNIIKCSERDRRIYEK